MIKKGDLALSVNAIVIVVISFVVLGLALTLTRSIFKFAGERAESVIPLTELEAKPTPDNPISISDSVSITKGGKQTLSIGYYNKNDYTAEAAMFSIAMCQDELGSSVLLSDQPTLTSPAQTVKPSEQGGYKVILIEKGKLQSAVYICTVAVHNSDTASGGTKDIDTIRNKLSKQRNKDNPVYETKQFFLKVTA